MSQTNVNLVTTILGTAGVLFILAGPAFNLIASTPALFVAIGCFVVAGAIRNFVKLEREQNKQSQLR